MYGVRRLQVESTTAGVTHDLPSIELDVHGARIRLVSNAASLIDAVREGYHYFEVPLEDDVEVLIALTGDEPDYDELVSTWLPHEVAPPHVLVAPSWRRAYFYNRFFDLQYGTGTMFTSSVLARLQDDYLAVHGAALTNGRRGVLLPGALRSGKSSLTLGLLHSGYRFASDDIAILDRSSLEVMPYPRLINVRKESLFHVPGIDRDYANMRYGMTYEEPRWFLDKSDDVAKPFRCHHVILPEFRSGATSLVPITKARAALRLLRSAFYPAIPGRPGRDTGSDLPTVSALLEGAQTHRLFIGNVRAAIDAITSVVGQAGGQPIPVRASTS